MEFDLGIDGIDELVQKLEGISATVDRNTNRILRESTEPLKEEIRRNTPLNAPGPKRPEKGHAKDHVVNSNVKRRDGEKYVEVGYESDWAWYMWFLEKGTYSLGDPDGIKPRHHVERSLENAKDKVGQMQLDGLVRVMELLGR